MVSICTSYFLRINDSKWLQNRLELLYLGSQFCFQLYVAGIITKWKASSSLKETQRISRLWSIPFFFINFCKTWKLFERETATFYQRFKGFRNIAAFKFTVILKLPHCTATFAILKVLNLQHSKNLHDGKLFLKKKFWKRFQHSVGSYPERQMKTANQSINMPFLQSVWYLLPSLLSLSLWGH